MRERSDPAPVLLAPEVEKKNGSLRSPTAAGCIVFKRAALMRIRRDFLAHTT